MMFLVDHLWQSTLFAAAAALLAASLRSNRAQTRYSIWLIASLKFLVPFSPLIALGARLTWTTTVPPSHPVLAQIAKQIEQPFAAAEIISFAPQTAASSAFHPLPVILSTLWICGFLAVLFTWLKQWRRIRAAVVSSTPLSLGTPIPALASPTLLEPGVVGVFHPVLLFPAGITAHLTRDHLAAILAHELCHVRRCDNLAAAVHMFVEAVFWFHPLVWWIGARLVAERERACDEEVLRLGNQPRIYAESILKTCQFFLESPLACVSGVTGSDLKQRVAHIMSGKRIAALNVRKKLLLTGAAIMALALPLTIGLMKARASLAGSPASFEVASIKPTKLENRGMRMQILPAGKLVASGITTKFLVEEAYNVKDAQISQEPSWFDSDRYDIEAKPDEAEAAAMNKLPQEQRKEQLMQMIRGLLADRFKLVLDHDTKDMQVYALTIAKSGSKLHESSFKPPDGPPPALPPMKSGAPPQGGMFMQGPGRLTSTGVELSMLANVLSRNVGRIVLDKTGLSGHYDFTLNWTPDESQGPATAGPPKEDGGAATPPEQSGISLFTALQEQLGLKLESQKAAVDVLVIKHVEKPSDN